MKFWQDHWCGETSLVVSYPKLFRFCRDQEVSVAEIMKFDNGILFWYVSFLGCACLRTRGTGKFHGYHIGSFDERVW